MAELNFDFLKQVPLFRHLTADELRAVSQTMRRKRARVGTRIFDRGDPGDGAYVVEHGQLAVDLVRPDGTIKTIARLGAGTVVGEVCLIEPAPRSMAVRAAEDCRLYFIDQVRFAELRASRHPAAYKVLREIALTLSSRLRETNIRIAEKWSGGPTVGTASAHGLEAERSSPWDLLKKLFSR